MQITRVVMPCDCDADGCYSFKQRQPRQWAYWTMWHLSKDLLSQGFKDIAIELQMHTSLAVDRVRLVPSDPPVMREVWPNMYVHPREQVVHDDRLDALDEIDARPQPKVAPRRGGVKVLLPKGVRTAKLAPPVHDVVCVYEFEDDEAEPEASKSIRERTRLCYAMMQH